MVKPSNTDAIAKATHRVSRTEKWRYWRVKLADDSRVSVNISSKSADKAGIAVDHSKLGTAEDISRWRTFWKGLLSQL